MRNNFFVLFLFFSSLAFAQNVIYKNESYGEINKNDFRLIDFFEYDVEGNKTETGNYTAKFKMNVKFSNQQTTNIWFRGEEGSIFFDTDFRWTLEKNQNVTIYFTVEHNSLFGNAYWHNQKLICVETSEAVTSKPWEKYIANGKRNLNGWYLEDLGNGTYQERFYKNGQIQNQDSKSLQKSDKDELEKVLKKKGIKDVELLKRKFENLSETEKDFILMFLQLQN